MHGVWSEVVPSVLAGAKIHERGRQVNAQGRPIALAMPLAPLTWIRPRSSCTEEDGSPSLGGRWYRGDHGFSGVVGVPNE